MYAKHDDKTVYKPMGLGTGSNGVAMLDDPPWLTIPDAARKLGVTQQAIRNRIKRSTLVTSRNNRNQIVVQLPNIEQTVCNPTDLGTVCQPFVPASDGTAAVSLPTALAMVADAVAAERAHAASETARQLAERDALHSGLVNWMAAQAALERGLMLERIDAAECRAERVEQRLDQVLDRLLERQPEGATFWRTFWGRWFGASKRSDLG